MNSSRAHVPDSLTPHSDSVRDLKTAEVLISGLFTWLSCNEQVEDDLTLARPLVTSQVADLQIAQFLLFIPVQPINLDKLYIIMVG